MYNSNPFQLHVQIICNSKLIPNPYLILIPIQTNSLFKSICNFKSKFQTNPNPNSQSKPIPMLNPIKKSFWNSKSNPNEFQYSNPCLHFQSKPIQFHKEIPIQLKSNPNQTQAKSNKMQIPCN